jgi:hypothetical protein
MWITSHEEFNLNRVENRLLILRRNEIDDLRGILQYIPQFREKT